MPLLHRWHQPDPLGEDLGAQRFEVLQVHESLWGAHFQHLEQFVLDAFLAHVIEELDHLWVLNACNEFISQGEPVRNGKPDSAQQSQ